MTEHTVLPPLETSIISVRNVLALAGLYLVYYVLVALYNISPFHPLSRIPGPKLAAATYWLEFYYDVVKNGCYTKEIAKMHEKYGKMRDLDILSDDLSKIDRSHRSNQSL